MVEIVEWQEGKLPPEPKFRMVKCAPPDGMERLESSTGTTVIVPEHDFDDAVADQVKVAEREGLSKLYVVRHPPSH